MNNARAIINLSEIRNLNQNESFIFSIFFGDKGTSYTKEKLFDKVSEVLVNGDAQDESKEVARVKGIITRSLNKLTDAQVLVKGDGENGATWTMPSYEIEDLKDDNQVGIGGKVHTTLTSNGDQVFYKGDVILYMTHPLSVEYKAGQRIGTGTIKSFHVNEEGFRYAIITKPIFGEDEKPKTCAVKLSQAQLLDETVPVSAKECVTYKKAAGLTKPELTPIGDCAKGNHIIAFNAIWSNDGVEMNQVVEGISDHLKNITVHPVNTDHQVDECIKYGIRTAPTMVIIKDGKEVARITGKMNSVEAYKLIKKAIK